MKNKKNKKAVTVVSVILIVLILIAVAVISVHKYREATTNKNIQKINISWSEFYPTNENDLSKFPAYTVNDCDVFCTYKINDNGTGNTVVRTDLKISDYVPYTIKYTLKMIRIITLKAHIFADSILPMSLLQRLIQIGAIGMVLL